LVRIATSGPIGSLNVSNAAAIALHHAAWKRR
jgi:23S rRNA (guanosine2251-2'-O)-methyltransferase